MAGMALLLLFGLAGLVLTWWLVILLIRYLRRKIKEDK